MQIQIDKDLIGFRLDKAVAKLTGGSRSFVSKQIKDGQVQVNGKDRKAHYTLKDGDVINHEMSSIDVCQYVAENIPLEIVYEDSDVAVVNKPQGMVVHPSNGHIHGTLVNALLYHMKDLSSINGDIRPGIVHRIDKDTSGLLIIAKNDNAHRKLAEDLKNRKSLRKYWSIVHGNFIDNHGVIDAPIGRNKADRKKYAVIAHGKDSLTRFNVLERFRNYTLLEIQLETGRTHQIRVHMSYIGHPVAGDRIYGLKRTLKGGGQFLHAKTLGFVHPTTNQTMMFSINVPLPFQEALEKLRKTPNL